MIVVFALREAETVPCGVEVLNIHEDTPALRASLRTGDVIIGFNGEIIHDLQAIYDAVGKTQPGDQTEIIYLRDNSKRIVEIILAINPNEPGRGYIGVEIATRFTRDPAACHEIG